MYSKLSMCTVWLLFANISLSSKGAGSVHVTLSTTALPSSTIIVSNTLNYCIRLGTEHIFPKDEIDTHGARSTPGLWYR